MARLGIVATMLVLLATACDGGPDAADVAATLPSSTAVPPAATTVPPDTTVPPTVPPETSVPLETTVPPTVPPTTAAVGRDFSALTPVVQDFVDRNGLNGAGLVVVDRDAGIVHEEYWGEFNAERVSYVASSSKMLTAGVLMRLAEDGLLDLDAPVADAVPWGSGNPAITPAQLVSNSSGLVGLGPNPAYPPYLCQFLPDAELEACGESVFLTPDDDADIVDPDTEFRYGGAQWQVAGAIAEAVSGKSWAELIDEIYVQPCGVESLGYNNHWIQMGGFDYPVDIDPLTLPPTDNPHMEGGAYIDPPDYAALLLMHLRGGECPAGRVMSPQSIERLHADRTLAAFPAGSTAPGYGMGWWVDRATGRISDGGAYGSVPWLDVDAGYGAYLVIEVSSALGQELSALIEPLIDDAMAG